MRRIRLHAPGQTIFILPIPPFWMLVIGYAILALGCWIRRI
ncbi:hypothetical protein [Breoghania sp.]|nr:hypothetical protein [Breoghania sp.]MDJ0932492.1 hypothetical protein [Breoghania sp.]